MRLTLVATCLFGLEHLLGEEIEALGYDRVETIDGRVTFAGDEEAVALANVNLRYAERVYILLGSFPAHTSSKLSVLRSDFTTAYKGNLGHIQNRQVTLCPQTTGCIPTQFLTQRMGIPVTNAADRLTTGPAPTI